MAARVVLIGVAVLLIGSSYGSAAWSPPTNLGPVVNSAVGDQTPAISKDGRSLFFQSNRAGGIGDQDIWVSQRESKEDPWGPPMNLGATVNSAASDGSPSFSRDGHWMFFLSNRPGGFGLTDIWAAHREHTHDDFGWGAPVNLGPGVNTAFIDRGASFFENDDCDDDDDDGDDERDGRRHGTRGDRGDDDDDDDDEDDDCAPLLFFASNRPGGLGDTDIYVSAQLPDGSWGAAALVAELNSPSGDDRPIIRFDGRELFLFSGRPGGFGVGDIWVSTRDSVTDPWTTPVNLGPTVNTPSFDGQAYLASDCKTLYFASNRPGGSGLFDLYVTSREKSDAPCGGR